ncbi:MAG TPA: TolC family outer membrane protein [Beijerinckiaceae bacterium]
MSAETLESALARAYGGNPTLNAQRASVRATDENVPRAKSLSRPRINATADAGAAYSESSAPGLEGEAATAALRSLNSANNATAAGGAGGVGGTGGRVGRSSVSRTLPRGFGVQVDQTLFNGFRTENSIRQAESQVLGARETLRNTEQDVLFQAAQFYMNVLRDTARLSLQRNNVEVLEEQLRQTRDRFNVGEVTRTDVAQAESRLALARSQVSVAESDLRTSIAQFRQIIGVEPRQLAPGRPVDRLVPGSIDSAIAIAMDEHPNIKSAMHAVDAAELQVKVTEGELLPSVTLSGAASQRYDTGQQGAEAFSAQLVARLTVPIYEGGEVYARARQAKEIAGQRRIDVETARDAVRATLIQSWGQLEAAKAQIIATQAQVQAAEIALNGVREEARVGQRTTLDVLNAQQELLNARVNLIIAQRDRVVFSYAVARSIGRLTTRVLGLNVAQYSAKQHFDQVKDLWGGLRIPDGR